MSSDEVKCTFVDPTGFDSVGISIDTTYLEVMSNMTDISLNEYDNLSFDEFTEKFLQRAETLSNGAGYNMNNKLDDDINFILDFVRQLMHGELSERNIPNFYVSKLSGFQS